MWVAACVAAFAPGVCSADTTSPANVAAARRHYDAAREDYSKGAYREAVAELEAAHALDPNAKDLVFNLGVVHEKLADFDEALKWFHLYTTMDILPPEQDRADAYIRRLEGAKKELEAKQAPPRPVVPEPTVTPAAPPPPPPPPEPPPHGRMDAATVSVMSLTVAALAFGVVMGVKALEDRPAEGFETGPNGSYADLQSQQDTAHREAIVADLGFGGAALGALATTVLYFARRRDPAAPTTTVGTRVAVSPFAGGGGLFVQGSF